MEVSLHLNCYALLKSSLFKNISNQTLVALSRRMKLLVHLPSDFIIREGDFGDSM